MLLLGTVFAVAWGAPGPARSEADRAAASDAGPAEALGPPWLAHLRGAPRLAGDAGGLRSRLASRGVGVQLFTNHFGSWKIRGGAEEGGETGHSASADLFVVTDLEELAGWRGGSFLLHLKSQYDRNVNGAVGALSDPIDDADFDEALYVDELWLQQDFAGGRLRVRGGFQEQQTMFDRNAFANSEDRQFMATALDNDPVVPLPNALALNVVAELAPWLELAAGVGDADNVPRRSGFETAFDDTGSLGAWLEATAHLRLPGPGEGLPGTWRVGIFRDGRELALVGEREPRTGSPRTRRGHPGAYLSVDQLLWSEAGEGGRSVGLFARAGLADEDAVAYPRFWSAGVQAVGALPGRRADVLGVGVHQRLPSSRFRDAVAPDAEAETGFEAYYAAALLPWLVVTPDLQVLLDPGGRPAETAVLATLRVRVTW